MTIPVRVNGSDPMPFIIDTGVERTVIAHDWAQQLALKNGRQLTLATVTGPAHKAILSDQTQAPIPYLWAISKRCAGTAKSRCLRIAGALTASKITKCCFKASKMDVLASPKQKKRTNRTVVEKDMIIVTAVRRAGRMILSNARIGNMNIDIILDTGAQSSMGNSALRKRLRGSQRLFGFTPATMRSVTGELLAGEFTQIRSIKCGRHGNCRTTRYLCR